MVKKAIIPIAGLGTRFLPLSKVLPKELWPLATKPVIQYIAEEVIASGIRDIILVNRKGKEIISEYLKDNLGSKISQVYQKEQLGDGHAVLQAERLIGQEPAAVLFGDDIVEAKTPALKQLIKVFNKYRRPVIALHRLPKEKLPSYGIVGVERIDKRLYKIKDIIEKPSIKQAPSNLAVVGKYVITPEVFAYLKKAPKAKGEIRLAGAFKDMIGKGKTIYGYEVKGKWLECGNIPTYLKSNLYLIKKNL